MGNRGDLTPWLTLTEWIRRTEKMDSTSTSVIKSPWIALSLIFGTLSKCNIAHLLGCKDFALSSCCELIKETGTSSAAGGESLLLPRAFVRRFLWSDAPRMYVVRQRDADMAPEEPVSYLWSAVEHGTSTFPLSSGPQGCSGPSQKTFSVTVPTLTLSTFYLWLAYFFFYLYFSSPVYRYIYVFVICYLKSFERGHIVIIIKITVAADILWTGSMCWALSLHHLRFLWDEAWRIPIL